MASFQLMKIALSSVSDSDGMIALLMLEIFNTDTMLGGNDVMLYINKCPHALLLSFVSERYEASLWTARTISLTWYVMTASGCVDA